MSNDRTKRNDLPGAPVANIPNTNLEENGAQYADDRKHVETPAPPASGNVEGDAGAALSDRAEDLDEGIAADADHAPFSASDTSKPDIEDANEERVYDRRADGDTEESALEDVQAPPALRDVRPKARRARVQGLSRAQAIFDMLIARSFLVLLSTAIGIATLPIVFGFADSLMGLVLQSSPFVVILVMFWRDLGRFERGLHQERAYAEMLEHRAVDYLDGDLVLASYHGIAELVPGAQREAAPVCNHIVTQIAHDAQHMAYQPRDVVVSPQIERLHSDLRQVGSLGPLALRLGILGTFVGFLISLEGLASFFGALSDEQNSQGLLEGFSDNLLGGLTFAFFTSVLGLIVSVIISVLVGRRLADFPASAEIFRDVAECAQRLGRARNANDQKIHAGLADIRVTLKETGERLRTHADTIGEVLSGHTMVVREQTKSLGGLIDGVATLGERWRRTQGEMERAQARTESVVTDSLSRIEADASNIANSVTGSLSDLNAAHERLATRMDRIDEQLETAITPLHEASDKMGREISGTIKVVSDTVSHIHTAVGKQLQETAELSATLRPSYALQGEAIAARLEDVEEQLRKLDRPKVFRGLIRFFGNLVLIVAAVFLLVVVQERSADGALEVFAGIIESAL